MVKKEDLELCADCLGAKEYLVDFGGGDAIIRKCPDCTEPLDFSEAGE